MLNIGIVEDNKEIAAELQRAITDYGREKACAFAFSTFYSSEDMLDSKKNFDVLFLDIELPGIDGMSAAQKIRETDKDVIIIFVTNVQRLVVKGYSVGAFDYLIKPINIKLLNMALDRTLTALSRRRTIKIQVNTSTGVVFLDSSEIAYVEVLGHNLIYHTGTGEVSEWASLNKPETTFKDGDFVRCNKCYLVNLKYVDGIDGKFVVVAGDKLKISQSKYKTFMDALNKYLSK